ncbi:hypothetical protein PINS_up014536 [Pythium insidiosum]|nr:hypothetical protein PINS_up014536 [Pythium insidiosum]
MSRPTSPVKPRQRHWTKAFTGEHETSQLGARFHLRKLFLRADVAEFSQTELAFIIQYLVHETTIAEQPWWAALTQYERLEMASRLRLHHVARGEERMLWFSSFEAAKDCILLNGSAEARPIDRNAAPVLRFLEGSVVGNLRIASSMLIARAGSTLSGSALTSDPSTHDRRDSLGLAADVSQTTWRRVKREQAFRNGLHLYNKITIIGPADYFLLSASDIMETILRAADRMLRDEFMRAHGLERFIGSIRQKTFEPGAVLVKEDERASTLYFIVEGECRATVQVDCHDEDDTTDSREDNDATETTTPKPKETKAAAQVLLRGRDHLRPRVHSADLKRRVALLPIASLGPNSIAGDASVLLGLREPVTIQAVTTVTTLALSQEDFARECCELRDASTAAPIQNLKRVAFETIGFMRERVQAEAIIAQCDQSRRLEMLQRVIAEKQAEVDSISSASIDSVRSFSKPQRVESTSVQAPHGQTSSSAPQQKKPSPIPESTAIPSVVQTYVESRHSHQASASSSTERPSLAPVIISRRGQHRLLYDADGSPPKLTREQQRAVIALGGLHSPLRGKSLADRDAAAQSASFGERRDEDSIETTMAHPSNLSEQLFLVPTMTRQRQLHARYVHSDARGLASVTHFDALLDAVTWRQEPPVAAQVPWV